MIENNNWAEKILKVKNDKNAVILAHYYQEPDIQDIADFVGDSLELSRKAKEAKADIIVFAGVHFMAETAKILNPSSKVLLPDLEAGCSLSDSCPPDKFGEFVAKHPDHVVISYINCSAEIKALSDIICTSSNALKIVQSIDKEQPIIFAPDKNLGNYIISQTGRDMVLWDGACMVHEAFSMDKLLNLVKEHPNAEIIAHPESETHILDAANFIGSTTALLKHVKISENPEFIVATEHGILHQMRKSITNKKLIPAPAKEDNTCACSECFYMKMNTMEKLYNCLLLETPEIVLSDDLIKKSKVPMDRMLALS